MNTNIIQGHGHIGIVDKANPDVGLVTVLSISV